MCVVVYWENTALTGVDQRQIVSCPPFTPPSQLAEGTKDASVVCVSLHIEAGFLGFSYWPVDGAVGVSNSACLSIFIDLD